MTLRSYKISIYAFLFALAVGTAWAQEQKNSGTCPDKWMKSACEKGVPFAGPILGQAFWDHWSQHQEATTFIHPIYDGGAIGAPIQVTLKPCCGKSAECCDKQASAECAKCCDGDSKCAGKCCATSDCCSTCSKQAGKVAKAAHQSADCCAGSCECCAKCEKCSDSDSKCCGKCCASSDCCSKQTCKQSKAVHQSNDSSACSCECCTRSQVCTRVYNCGDLLGQYVTIRYPGFPARKRLDANAIIEIATNAIAPESWSKAGGKGTIDFFPLGEAVVVCQTPDCQEQVAELLQALRLSIGKEVGGCCPEQQVGFEDWVMQFMPCPDPAFFMPWTMFSPPMMAMPWEGPNGNEDMSPSPFRLTSQTIPASYTVEVTLVANGPNEKPNIQKLWTATLEPGVFSQCRRSDGISGKMHLWPSMKNDCVGVELQLENASERVSKMEVCKTCKIGKKTRAALRGDTSTWLEIVVKKAIAPTSQSAVMTGVGVNSDADLTGYIMPNPRDWRFSTSPVVVAVAPPMPPCCPPATANPVCPPPVATAVLPPMPYCLPSASQNPIVAPPAPVAQCVALETVPASRQEWTMRTVCEGDKTKLSVGCDNDAKLCCDHMDLKANGCGSVHLAPQGSQIAVSCNGVQALADCVNKTEHGVQLKGHVRMCTFAKEQCHCSCFVDEAELSWKDGQMHFQCSWPKSGTMPSQRHTPRAATFDTTGVDGD